jgi:hypothetical protein
MKNISTQITINKENRLKRQVFFHNA